MKRSPAPKRRKPLPRPTKPLKRGAPLKRGKPPRRKRWLRRGGSTTKYARRERDVDFMGFCRRLPCAVAMDVGHRGLCRRRVEFDHARNAGMSHKCSDREGEPLCGLHHVEKTERKGYFAGWTDAQLDEWLDYWNGWAISLYLASQGAL